MKKQYNREVKIKKSSKREIQAYQSTIDKSKNREVI